MKKILMATVVFAFVSKYNTTHAQIRDTLAYLNDSIVAKKANFINKPLSVLFSSLKVPITKYFGEIPYSYLPDTLIVTYVDFSFSNPSQAITRLEGRLPEYNIHILLAKPQQIPKKYFKPGNTLDWTTDWTTAKANYLSTFVISDIQ